MSNFFQPQLKRVEMIVKNLFPFEGIGDELDITLDFGSAGMARDDKINLHQELIKRVNGRIIGIDIRASPQTDIIINLDGPLDIFPPESITNIIAGEVIEHLKNPYQFLKECERILKPDGRLIITTPNAEGIQLIIGRESPWHNYIWTKKNFECLVKKTNLKIIKSERINIYYNKNLLLRGIGYLFPKIRPTLFFVLEK